ncbi:hypothetical protein DW987_13460 [Ruminococcus sp. AM50-15BH]|nr:hypothetical protein DW987_13460 [Ruminococcus sp. AM50-15BH]
MTALLLILVFLLFQTFVLLCCVAAGNDAASQEISDQEQMEFIREWKKHIAAALKNKGLLQCADKPSTSHNSHIVLLFLLIYKKALFHQDRRS